MKVLKGLVLALFALMVLLGVVGMTMPGTWQVQRSLDMEARPSVVFGLINSADGWDTWTAWAKESDPTWAMEVSSPQRAGPGTTLVWRSEVYGGQTVKIVATDPPEQVSYTLHLNSRDVDLEGTLSIEETDEGSRVTWLETSDIGTNPYERLLAKVMKGMVEADFDRGLGHMKTSAEAREQQQLKAEAMEAVEEQTVKALLDQVSPEVEEAMRRAAAQPAPRTAPRNTTKSKTTTRKKQTKQAPR